ncbi:MAG TPA: TonB-dependent receptor plug domain-containing protein, partial [Gemmatimonadales bacterium]|nr:TonB-dependent receptor plug domain-containing protein [Gemmatimonadales bacterium]
MRFRLFTTGIILLGAAVSLHAQQPDSAKTDSVKTDSSAIQLQEIEVVGSIAPTAGATIGSGVPARISVVTGEEIDKWEPRLLADALVTQPGISLYDDLGSPFKLNLSTRGFNVGPVVGLPPGVSVFLDGVRQNEPDAQEVNFDLLPMEHVRRLELLSGSGSLLGANSLGGAINLITRRGTGPLEGELEGSGGSYGNWSGEGSLAGLTKKGMDYYVAGGYENDDGWREATSAENYNGFVNLGKRNAVRGITLQGFGAHSRAETAGSLPESIFDTDPSVNFTTGDFEDLDLLQLATSGYVPLGSGRLNFGAYGRRSTAERFNVNQAPDDNVRSLTTNGTVGLNLDWRRAWPVGNDAISLRIGSDVAVNRVHVKLFEEDPINASDKTLTTDVKSPSWDVAGYALADYRTGRATFSGGFRYDYIRIPFEDQLDPSADTSSSFNRLSPRGGVSLDLGRGFSAYGSISYPQSYKHLFCYAYYVTPPPTSGTIKIVKRIPAGNTSTETFHFGGNVSFNPGGTFDLKVTNGAAASMTFVRADTGSTAPWVVTEKATADWRPSGPPTCTTVKGSATTIAGQTISISLLAGDTVTCTYSDEPIP